MSDDERQEDPETLTCEVLARQRALEAALSQANAMRAQAETACRELGKFLELLSHELRSPLAAIRLQLELLALRLPESLSREQSDVIARIERSSSRLAETVASILPLAGLESGRVVPDLTELDLRAFAAHTVEQFRERAAAKALTIRLDGTTDGALIASDPELLRLIIAKLCDNAIHHASASASAIVVTVDHGAAGHVARLCVRDEGPGIPTAESQRLEQLDARNTRRSDECFTLSLVKRVAAALGAQVVVESGGSCVCLWFPSSPP